MGISVVGSKVYLFGGSTLSSGSNEMGTNTIFVFNVDTQAIETLATTLPVSIMSPAAGAVGTKIYLFIAKQNVLVFDTTTNTIETVSESWTVDRHTLTPAVVGNIVYLFCGFPKSHNDTSLSSKLINKFTAPIDLYVAPDTAYMRISVAVNLFLFIKGENTVELGAGGVYIGAADGTPEQVNAYLYNEETANWTLIE